MSRSCENTGDIQVKTMARFVKAEDDFKGVRSRFAVIVDAAESKCVTPEESPEYHSCVTCGKNSEADYPLSFIQQRLLESSPGSEKVAIEYRKFIFPFCRECANLPIQKPAKNHSCLYMLIFLVALLGGSLYSIDVAVNRFDTIPVTWDKPMSQFWAISPLIIGLAIWPGLLCLIAWLLSRRSAPVSFKPGIRSKRQIYIKEYTSNISIICN